MKVSAELVSRCFAARTAAHVAHLTTRSYAQHVALGDFYDAVAGAADAYVECWQGVHGALASSDFSTPRLESENIVVCLTRLRTWIADHRDQACCLDESAENDDDENTELANLVDEILAVIDRTVYKLKFLK